MAFVHLTIVMYIIESEFFPNFIFLMRYFRSGGVARARSIYAPAAAVSGDVHMARRYPYLHSESLGA